MKEPYVVVSVPEQDGNSVPAVFNPESQAASFGRASCTNGMVVHADEATWDQSHERLEIKRINRQAAQCLDGACSDMATEPFSRLRRAEAGDVAGSHFLRYAQESSRREQANGSPALNLSDN
jgi:hypothetical protein